MNYYISDLHFGHKNAISFDERPFDNVNEMARVMIDGWNKKVSEDDNVYILGDFTYRDDKSPEWYLKQLNGHKHLIIGNHDGLLIKDTNATRHFETIDKMMHVEDEISGTHVHIVLCHFPILHWNKKRHGSYHIYGHIHSHDYETSKIMYEFSEGRALNAGCMINHYVPCSLRELITNNEIYYNAFIRK